MSRYILKIITLSFIITACSSSNNNVDDNIVETDILVVGGSTSGVAAAIQAARAGSSVILVEKTTWLGGMLTSAGVSATDGNHNLPSGIWGEFRQKLYDHYGGPDAIATGWVSNTHFEPEIGNKIWHEMIVATPGVTVYKEYFPDSVEMNQNAITGISFRGVGSLEGKNLNIKAKITIDATELGDIIGLSDTECYMGQDPKSLTGEELASDISTPYIQDLTYVAILEEYEGTDHLLEKPEGYDPKEFDCLCKEICDDPEFDVVDCETMLNYAKLPNNKYLINWPNNGNDYYLNPIEMSYEERLKAYEKAKLRTLNWVYHIQTVGGYKNLGLSKSTFGTSDNLAVIPYHRESRRIKGVSFLTVDDLKDPYRNDYYKMGVAVGDYPVDHHHKKNPLAFNEFKPETDFPIPSFSIPYGSMVPVKTKNLIVAEKSISVSHIANGSTRLQPCVISIGQAAGLAAHLCLKENVQPAQLSVRLLQSNLLNNGAYILPYIDVKPSDWFFKSLQKFGALGIIKANPVPYQWANQTWIYPDTTVTNSEFVQIMKKLEKAVTIEKNGKISRGDAAVAIVNSITEKENSIEEAIEFLNSKNALDAWEDQTEFMPNQAVTRAELVYVLDKLFDPFNKEMNLIAENFN